MGDSAYDLWLANGNKGTHEDFIQSLSDMANIDIDVEIGDGRLTMSEGRNKGLTDFFCSGYGVSKHRINKLNISEEAVMMLYKLYNLYDTYGRENVEFNGFFINSQGERELNYELTGKEIVKRSGPIESHRMDILDFSDPDTIEEQYKKKKSNYGLEA